MTDHGARMISSALVAVAAEITLGLVVHAPKESANAPGVALASIVIGMFALMMFAIDWFGSRSR